MRIYAGLFFVTLILSACGKKGPLVYPDMLVPAAPAAVSAQQSGNNIRLTFGIPVKDRSGRPRSDVAGIKIYKRDLMAGQDKGCTSCTADFNLFRTWFLDVPGESQRFGDRVVILDGGVQSGRSYTYSFSAFAHDGTEGIRSAPVTTDVVLPPLAPVLRAVSLPTEVTLEFVGLPLAGEFAGYSLYRAVKGQPFPYRPYISSLLKENRFTDMGLERGTTYMYAARIVVRLSTGVLVESGLSGEVEGKLQDDE